MQCKTTNQYRFDCSSGPLSLNTATLICYNNRFWAFCFRLILILFFRLILGLPIQVRDAGLSFKDDMPKSDVNKEYYTQNMEREVRNAFLTESIGGLSHLCCRLNELDNLENFLVSLIMCISLLSQVMKYAFFTYCLDFKL